MRTHTTMLLLMLFAVSLNGCGRTGGGASEVTAQDPSAEQQQPNIRVAEATATQGTTSSPSTGVVEDGVYEVCDVEGEGEARMGGKDRPTGPHITLRLSDEVVVKKGEKNDPVGSVVFRHFAKPEAVREKREKLKPQKETSVTVIKCCEGERLGATMGFEHEKAGETAPRSVLHAMIIENAPTYRNCTRKPVIVVRFCYPTLDDGGAHGWSCGSNDQNPHGGDVHAQL